MASLIESMCAVITDRAEARSLGVTWTLDQWCDVVDLAHQHGMAGLLLRAFSRQGWPTAMPAEVRGELHAIVYEATGHNLKLFTALASILVTLEPITPVIVLKGMALSEEFYHGATLRPSSDIDILVDKTALSAVQAALAQLGYDPIPSLAPELITELDPHLHLSGGPGDDVQLEVHWTLMSGSADWRAAPVQWFWEQQQAWQPPKSYLQSGGMADYAKRLNDTASLLYQAAHLVLRHGHDPARLIWIYDLHLLVSQGQIDWDLLVQQARVLGWEAALALALDEAQRYFGTHLPETVLPQLRRPLDSRVYYRGPEATYVPMSSWDMLKSLRVTTQLRMLVRLALPHPAYLRASYGSSWGLWWPLAYPYRWFKPLGRLARRLVRPTPARMPWLR